MPSAFLGASGHVGLSLLCCRSAGQAPVLLKKKGKKRTTHAFVILTHGSAHLQELSRICNTLQDQLVIAEVRHPAIVGCSSAATFDTVNSRDGYIAFDLDG